MDFRVLEGRLLAQVQARVRNGAITERSLARLMGISQPHMHNVLKGVRLLTSELADQILRVLHIDLVELMAGERATCETPPLGECRAVPLLKGWLSRSQPFPEEIGEDHYAFSAADVDRLDYPLAARLAPDPRRLPAFQEGGVLLMDCADRRCLIPDARSYYVLNHAGSCAVGLVRRAGSRWLLLMHSSHAWESAPALQDTPRKVIKGRVALVVCWPTAIR